MLSYCELVATSFSTVPAKANLATLVIESEQCHMYLPSKLTYEQVNKCLELIDLANEYGKFSLLIYDSEQEIKYTYDINLVSIEKTRNYLLRIGNNEQQIDDVISIDDSSNRSDPESDER